MPKEKPRVNIGEVIKSYRSQRGLSQGDIERRTGLLRCYLSRVENGHTVPSLETLAKIAEAMDISLADFFPRYRNAARSRNAENARRTVARRNPLPRRNQALQHHAIRWRQAPRPGHDPQNGHSRSATNSKKATRPPTNRIVRLHLNLLLTAYNAARRTHVQIAQTISYSNFARSGGRGARPSHPRSRCECGFSAANAAAARRAACLRHRTGRRTAAALAAGNPHSHRL